MGNVQKEQERKADYLRTKAAHPLSKLKFHLT